MKKVFTIAITLLITLNSLTGCGNGETDKDTASPIINSTSQDTSFTESTLWYSIDPSKQSYQIDNTYDCVAPGNLRASIEENGGFASTIFEDGFGKYGVCFNQDNTMHYAIMTFDGTESWSVEEITSKEYLARSTKSKATRVQLSEEKKLSLSATIEGLLEISDPKIEKLFSILTERPLLAGIQYYGSDYFSASFDNTGTRERLIVFFSIDNLEILYFDYYHVLDDSETNDQPNTESNISETISIGDIFTFTDSAATMTIIEDKNAVFDFGNGDIYRSYSWVEVEDDEDYNTNKTSLIQYSCYVDGMDGFLVTVKYRPYNPYGEPCIQVLDGDNNSKHAGYYYLSK